MTSLFLFLDEKMALLPPLYVALIYVSLLLTLCFVSYYKSWLSLSGLVSSFVLGYLVLHWGGFSAFTVLLFFFLTSSLLTKINKKEKNDKDGRNALQVISNSFTALVFLLLSYYTFYKTIFLIAYASALSASLSDTWASEIGALSKKEPVSILNGKRVRKGSSGGVTTLGTLASFFGSLLMGLLYIGIYKPSIISFVLIAFSGFLGSVIDSFLGASFECVYKKEDGELTDKKEDERGKNTYVRGLPFFTNNVTNFISSLLASSFSFLISFLIYK